MPFGYKENGLYKYVAESEQQHEETPLERQQREEKERKEYWNDYWNNKAQPCIID